MGLYELVARYTFCCLGVLHAEWLIGDLGSYRSRLEAINSGYQWLAEISPRAVYLSRCDQFPQLALDTDYQWLSTALVGLKAYSTEAALRLGSFAIELDYIERNKLSTTEYRRALLDAETGIVVLPHDFP